MCISHECNDNEDSIINLSNINLADLSAVDALDNTEFDRSNRYILGSDEIEICSPNTNGSSIISSHQSARSQRTGAFLEDRRALQPDVEQSCRPDFVRSCSALLTEMPSVASPIFERKISDQSASGGNGGGAVFCCFDEAGMPLLSLAFGTSLLPRAQLGLLAAVHTSCHVDGFDLRAFNTADTSFSYRCHPDSHKRVRSRA